MIKLSRSLKRETPSLVRERGKSREVIIELRPPFNIALRLKGTRRAYSITAAGLYQVLVKDEAVRLIMERKAARKARGEGR